MLRTSIWRLYYHLIVVFTAIILTNGHNALNLVKIKKNIFCYSNRMQKNVDILFTYELKWNIGVIFMINYFAIKFPIYMGIKYINWPVVISLCGLLYIYEIASIRVLILFRLLWEAFDKWVNCVTKEVKVINVKLFPYFARKLMSVIRYFVMKISFYLNDSNLYVKLKDIISNFVPSNYSVSYYSYE